MVVRTLVNYGIKVTNDELNTILAFINDGNRYVNLGDRLNLHSVLSSYVEDYYDIDDYDLKPLENELNSTMVHFNVNTDDIFLNELSEIIGYDVTPFGDELLRSVYFWYYVVCSSFQMHLFNIYGIDTKTSYELLQEIDNGKNKTN